MIRLQSGHRLVHLFDRADTAVGTIGLRREKQVLANAQFRDEVAEYGFRRTVHWRRVDHRTAEMMKPLERGAQWRAGRLGITDAVAIGAQADNGQRLAR